MTKTVTFQTILVPSLETAKAFCVLGGDYRPKSLCTVEYVDDEYLIDGGQNRFGKKLPPIIVRLANITMPEWLAKKI
jgi:hypothetical protein